MIWVNISSHIPRHGRYTVGARIENKFLDLLELSYVTYFTEKENKLNKISDCIITLDIIKFLTSISWEGKFLSDRQFEEISEKLVEIGRMFGGWKKSIENPQIKTR